MIHRQVCRKRLLARAACFLVLGIAAFQNTSAEPTKTADLGQQSETAAPGSSRDTERIELVPLDRCAPAPIILGFGLDALADITGGHADPGRRSQLLQIAIYASLGNREAMEIAMNRLRKFGLTREAVQEAIDWAKLDVGIIKRTDAAATSPPGATPSDNECRQPNR